MPTRLSRGHRSRFVVRLMAALIATMAAVGSVQYIVAERTLTNRALAQLATTHQADAKVIRRLYEQATADEGLNRVTELLNHVAMRPGVLHVALLNSNATVVAVGLPSMAAGAPAHGASPPAHGAPSHQPTLIGHAPAEAPAPGAAGPGRLVGTTVEAPSAATIRRVAAGVDVRTTQGDDDAKVTVLAPVLLGDAVHVLEVLRSTVELHQQVQDLRRLLLLTLAACLPFAIPGFYLLGGRSMGNRFGRAMEDSATDALTGLRNHRSFHRELTRQVELARRHGRPLTLALVDLDGFKQVNDTRGHLVGDRVLAAVGMVLRQGRPEDLPFRIGGDEFAVLLPETDATGARTAVERIRRRVEAEIDGVTTSIGLAGLGVHAPDIETLLHTTDAALYAAKRAGRNRVVNADDVTAAGHPAFVTASPDPQPDPAGPPGDY